MYVSKNNDSNGGGILKAGMDGSNPIRIVTALGEPCGIIIDYHSSRLYWADLGTKEIQSSNLEGGDIVTVITLQVGPYGIALLGDKLYWGHYQSNAVQSCSTSGTGLRTVHDGTTITWQFTVPAWGLSRNRTDHCEQHTCSNVCVLTPTSFRCLS